MQKNYSRNDLNSPVNQRIDALQTSLHCCGLNGPSDWATSTYNNTGVNPFNDVLSKLGGMTGLYSVPPSCCVRGVGPDLCEVARQINAVGIVSDLIHHQGCLLRLLKIMNGVASVITGSAHSLIVLMHTGSLILTVVLYLITRQENDTIHFLFI